MKNYILKIMLTLWLLAGLAAMPARAYEEEDDWWDNWREVFYGDDGVPAGLTDEQEEQWLEKMSVFDIDSHSIDFDVSNDNNVSVHYSGQTFTIPDNAFNLEFRIDDSGTISMSYTTTTVYYHYEYEEKNYTDGYTEMEEKEVLDWIEKTTTSIPLIDSDGNSMPDHIQDDNDDGVPNREEPYEDSNVNDLYDPSDYEFEEDNSGSSSNEYPLPDIANNQGTTSKDPTVGYVVPPTEERTPANEAMLEVQRILEVKNEQESIKDTLNAIRMNAQNKLDQTILKEPHIEYGAAIQFYFSVSGNHTCRMYKSQENNTRSIIKGDEDSINVSYTVNTNVTTHSHPEPSNNKKYNIAPPSPQDFEATLRRAIDIEEMQLSSTNLSSFGNEEAKQAYIAEQNRHYKGELVFSYNGDEYFLLVQDLEVAKEFLKTYGEDFANEIDFNKGKIFRKLRGDFRYVIDELTIHQEPPFSENEARCFALAYVMENNNAGITMMKKTVGSDTFAEQTFERDKNGNIDTYSPVSKKHP